MVRSMHKLTARKVASVKDAGRYSDGAGLYLRVGRSNDKRWVFRYTLSVVRVFGTDGWVI